MLNLLLNPFLELKIFIKKHPVFSIIVLALAICLSPLSRSDFPLNDGGLFYTMIQDLKENNFKLPIFTTYNQAQIPFAYPPLSFYLAGFISKVLPIPLIEILHFLPLIISLLTIPIFFLVAKNFWGKEIAIIPTLIFVLLPRSFIWIIMGGGIARSLGLFLAFLAFFLE